ncbi:MAG: hypothetical protein EB075_06320 [Bacteroidetes bacterium]|nr:hypothetical protein [Bacteroidota bacterium]
MARIRRVVVATHRVSIRHTETPNKKTSTRALREMRDSILTRAFLAQGIELTPEDIEARGFRLSTPREYYHGHEVIGFEYDITARV